MPKAEIITIGTELLLGEIVDTNTPYIARNLRDYGIDIFYTCSVGDNPDRIAQVIKEAHSRADIIISTGGLGPTIDDPTRQGAALAFDTKLVFNQKAWEQVIERFEKFGKYPTENNRQQALFPIGAKPIKNAVGTAPIFYYQKTKKQIYIALPGVPSEMKYLFTTEVIPLLKETFILDSVLVSRILHTSGLGESTIDMKISDLEKSHNPTVGLAAKVGQVDIRIAAKASTKDKANQLLDKMETSIRDLLDDAIYGTDQDNLEELAIKNLINRNYSYAIVEAGLQAKLINNHNTQNSNLEYAKFIKKSISKQELIKLSRETFNNQKVTLCLGVSLYNGNPHKLITTLIINNKETVNTIEFTRPDEQAISWAVNICNNLLRQID